MHRPSTEGVVVTIILVSFLIRRGSGWTTGAKQVDEGHGQHAPDHENSPSPSHDLGALRRPGPQASSRRTRASTILVTWASDKLEHHDQPRPRKYQWPMIASRDLSVPRRVIGPCVHAGPAPRPSISPRCLPARSRPVAAPPWRIPSGRGLQHLRGANPLNDTARTASSSSPCRGTGNRTLVVVHLEGWSPHASTRLELFLDLDVGERWCAPPFCRRSTGCRTGYSCGCPWPWGDIETRPR